MRSKVHIIASQTRLGRDADLVSGGLFLKGKHY